MSNSRWYQALLILLLAVAAGAAAYAAAGRYHGETGNRRVELAMPFEQIQRLAGLSGRDTLEVMNLFRAQGLTSVFYTEATLDEWQKSGALTVLTGRDLYLLYRSGAGTSNFSGQGKINPEDTCFVTAKRAVALQLAEQLEGKGITARVYALAPGGFVEEDRPAARGRAGGPPAGDEPAGGAGLLVVATPASRDTLAGLGLGFPPDALDLSRQAGLRAIVQVRAWPGVTARGLEGVFKPLRQIPHLAAVAFYGDTLPGYPDRLPDLQKNMAGLGVPVIQIEFQPQRGLTGLADLMGDRVLRMHQADPADLKIYSVDSLISRLELAAAERNVRLLLVYPVVEPGTQDCLTLNLRYVGDLTQALAEKGLTPGPAQPLPLLVQPRWLLFLVGLGVIAGGLLLLLQLGVRRFNPLVGLFSLLAWAGLLAVAPQMARNLMALAAAVIFPVLSIQGSVKPGGTTGGRSVFLLIRTTLLTLPGALLMVGLLADSGYMLKLRYFTGVKMAYVLPLLFLAVIFTGRGLAGESKGHLWERAARLLDRPLLLKWVLAAVFLLVVLIIFLMRTGTQEIIPPSGLELKFRSLLNHLLYVRPRTKEFLIGHPLLLLLFYYGYRDNRFLPLLLLGAIGQISVINTFMHIHTPLAVSVLRVFHGLWLGILTGLLLIPVWRLCVFSGRKILSAVGKAENEG
ncbi:hypothetical protein GFC01_04485 [Desulfofundulus thermobenzoicus]|uniref:Uncharacterized protein n=1 Tax=Desulfofundulus thermobenzoicus TaxID=29376 RepID=A0A6N7ING1_9FIRM|nr:DUF5693 family protein [Desulfofundulus thermobenzoicus]MQL51532.1 hypothetical protein [Desulfofundulus thermobenzoicus]